MLLTLYGLCIIQELHSLTMLLFLLEQHINNTRSTHDLHVGPTISGLPWISLSQFWVSTFSSANIFISRFTLNRLEMVQLLYPTFSSSTVPRFTLEFLAEFRTLTFSSGNVFISLIPKGQSLIRHFSIDEFISRGGRPSLGFFPG
jgi:hypothetical protein